MWATLELVKSTVFMYTGWVMINWMAKTLGGQEAYSLQQNFICDNDISEKLQYPIDYMSTYLINLDYEVNGESHKNYILLHRIKHEEGITQKIKAVSTSAIEHVKFSLDTEDRLVLSTNNEFFIIGNIHIKRL